jgi:chemotaxis protein CheZ
MDTTDVQLHARLTELTRYLTNEFRKAVVVEEHAAGHRPAQLPSASAHLKDVLALMENGTHRVMALIEMLQANRLQIAEALEGLAGHPDEPGRQRQFDAIRHALATEDARLMEMMTALSFQDLAGQRVKIIAGILRDVERQLLEMLIAVGGHAAAHETSGARPAGELLHELETAADAMLSQELVDDILGQYGYN